MQMTTTIMRVLTVATVMVGAGCDRSAAVRDADERGEVALKQARAKREVPAQAITAYRQILDDNPRMALAHLDLALLLHDSAKDYVGAIHHYRRYLELRPDAQKASMINGRIQDATRRFAIQARGDGQVTNAVTGGLSLDMARIVEENASLKIEVARLTQELESLQTQAPVRVPVVEQPPPKPPASVEHAQAPPSAGKLAGSTKPRMYKVRPRDTLSSIAESFYGDRSQWKRILDANGSVLKSDPKRLREGMELSIP